jgi:Carboxypeptidase regulatory-like domain
MSNFLQPGRHPDANQLNAFIEGVLPEHERKESLAHLAECAECRRIVFLAQAAELPETPVVATQPISFWQRWFRPFSLVGAAAAVCALLVVVSVHMVRTPKEATPNEARNSAAASPQAAPTSVISSPESPAPQRTMSDAELQATVAASRIKEPRRAVVPPVKEPKANMPVGVAGGIGLGAGAAMADSLVAPASSAAPANPMPAAAPQPPQLASGQVKGLPLAGRNADSSVNATERLTVRNGAPRAVPATGGALKLTIEHDQGPVDGLSALTGSVTDATGAVIPRATVTLRGPAGAASSTSTDSEGRFAMPAVSAGRYEIEIASPGFLTLSQQIELQPRDLAQVRSMLTVGSETETVEVSAASSNVQTESAAMVGTIAAHVKVGKQPIVSSATSGKVELVVDSAGTVFLSENAGGHWKKLKPEWQGRAIKLSTVASSLGSAGDSVAVSAGVAAGRGAAVTSPRFQLTTSSGELWVSADGKHWQRP